MEFPDISKLWERHPDRLGVDFDSHSMRVIKLARKAENVFDLAACGAINVSIRQTTPLDQQRAQAFLKQVSGGLTRAAISIDDPSLRIRRMNFVKMPERDLIEAIKWNFREHIDCPIEEYEIGYTPIDGWSEGEQLAYTAYGASRSAVKECAEVAKQAGLKPVALEPQATALLAAFDYNINWSPKSCVVCLSIGRNASYFTVMSEGQLLFSRPMAGISYEVMIKIITRTMSVDENGAEDILMACFSRDENELLEKPDFAEAKGIFFSQLVIETQRSIDAFSILFGVDHVDSIHVCGMGAYCPGIVAHMQKTLGVPTSVFDPFARVSTGNIEPAVREKSAMFAVAFGLAIP